MIIKQEVESISQLLNYGFSIIEISESCNIASHKVYQLAKILNLKLTTDLRREELYRPTTVEYNFNLINVIKSRGTCKRRKTGALLMDNQKRIISTGYNGPAPGAPHCSELECGIIESISGQDLDKCDALHAEASALMSCKNRDDIISIFCSTAPCIHCIKLLLATPCQIIAFKEDYPHLEKSKEMWKNANRIWIKYNGILRDQKVI